LLPDALCGTPSRSARPFPTTLTSESLVPAIIYSHAFPSLVCIYFAHRQSERERVQKSLAGLGGTGEERDELGGATLCCWDQEAARWTPQRKRKNPQDGEGAATSWWKESNCSEPS